MIATTGTKNSSHLLLNIARCPIVEHCLANPASRLPCAEIVRSQAALGIDPHLLPEPWSGHLAQAPILFVSSNPSIGGNEDHPSALWPDHHVIDYYENRFGNGRKAWIKDGIYGLDRFGNHSRRGVAFWQAVRARAAELHACSSSQVRPGVDYALTEVVHCNSKQELGVRAAADACTDRYLAPVIAQSGASIIVCLGTIAAAQFRRAFALSKETMLGPIALHGKPRYVVCLPHPNARQPRTFAARLPAADLAALRAVLATA